MSTDVFYGITGDGFVYSTNATYATARTGSGQFAATTFLRVGQYWDGSAYYCYEGFLGFDTSSIPDTDTVSAATLSIMLETDNSTTDFTTQARLFTWSGSGLTTADWTSGASLTETLLATLNSSGIVAVGNYADFTDSAMPANINKTGNTEIRLNSSRHAAGNTPTGHEELRFYASVQTGTTQDPKLTVTHTAVSSTKRSFVVMVG